MLRCLLVDDNTSFLEASARLLEREGILVVGVAHTIEEALQRTQELHPDVVLIDITLGPESGFELARRLARTGTAATMILISTHSEADFADLINETPAVGFVPKSELSAERIYRLVGGVQHE